MPTKKAHNSSVTDLIGLPAVQEEVVSPKGTSFSEAASSKEVSLPEAASPKGTSFSEAAQPKKVVHTENTDTVVAKSAEVTQKPQNDGSVPSVQTAQPVQFYPRPKPQFHQNADGVTAPAAMALQGPTEEVQGILDLQMEGHGFLRPKFVPSNRDVYISQSQIRRFMLRAGDKVAGVARPPKDNERYYGLLKVEKVNDQSAESVARRPWFDDLTPVYPNKQVTLSMGKTPVANRIIDLVAPIGFGQRGMIVSPPKAGKTTIIKDIAAGIAKNFPDVHLMAALIAERPEEVTDISQSVKGEVVASNFDESPENQIRVAEITLERAKRLVEMGKDVVILLDSITRLARAYNLGVAPSGRTLSGGFDPAALFPAKKFFGAARNCQEGGSLTIIGTALIETGSRMDDLIYEEFKGTGNMELHLVRSLAERRVFPAIDVAKSGTREEQRILSEETYKQLVVLHRMLDMLNPEERTERFIEQLNKTESNEDFLKTLKAA